MSTTTGLGGYTYEVDKNWAKVPDGPMYDVAGVGVDARNNVYLFNRGEHPVIVLDSQGNFLHCWGDKKMFPNAHAVTMGPDDTIWLTDTFDHTVRKCTLDGKVLMTLGVSGKPAQALSGEPFNQCTHLAIHPGTGDLFVSDGYLNAKVHKYSPDGRLLYSWGEPGNEPGQFNLPHNICADRDGNIYVADRQNNRVQVFTPNGKLEAVWTGMALPCGMCIDTRAAEQLCYIGELSSAGWTGQTGDFWQAWNAHAMGPRISIYSLDGRLLAKVCDNGQGEGPEQLIAPHGIAVSAEGDIYVGEVSWTFVGRRLKPPRPLQNFAKLVKVKRSKEVTRS
ncbi:MAG TPA: peptidyl-alpha-hydroxyglycine alpha-amidating lyase family protein [Candidatus Binataceae bacterium]|nr:peptidyl-alpha-hydroxyglycine alpha-amidating lyase family protein [Candidatus Binataceae bacterium]